MQEDVKALCRRTVEGEKGKRNERFTLEDFGFYDPEGILEWGFEYLRSNFNPGHLPKSGGLRNQTIAVKHDIRMLENVKAWAEREYASDEEAAALVDQFQKQNIDYTR